jgi:hypothetical protein
MRVLELRNRDGSFLGACDSRCYDSTTEKCTCVCCGLNHGKGKEVALRETARFLSGKENKDNNGTGWSMPDRARQMSFNFSDELSALVDDPEENDWEPEDVFYAHRDYT